MTVSFCWRSRAARSLRALWAIPLLLALACLLGAAPARAGVTVTITQGPPSSVVSCEVISPPIVANIVGGITGETVTASLTTPGSATLSGNTTTLDSSGNATFNNLTVDRVGTYTLTVTSQDLVASQPSSPFDVTPSLSVAFTQQPTDTPSQQPIQGTAPNTPAGVKVHLTSLGTNQSAAGQSVTISLMTMGSPNPSPTLSSSGATDGTGTTATMTGTTDANGDLTFTGLSIDIVGTYQLSVSATDNGGNTVTATSSNFKITPGAPATLTFTQQPASLGSDPTEVPVGLALDSGTANPGVQVQVMDAAGNLVPGQAVTVALSGQSGTLTGTTTEAANASGVAVFRDLTAGPIGTGYTLTATAGEASVVSSPFNVIADPALIVTSKQDDGNFGTLRSVLGFAPAGSTVTFGDPDFPVGGSEQTIMLLGGEIDVTKSVTLTAPSNGVIVNGNGQSRVFGFTGGPVGFTGVTIVGGQAPNDGAPFFGNGGGLAVGPGAVVTFTNCQIAANSNTGAGSGNGGGIYNDGSLTLTGCLVGTFPAGGTGNPGGGNAAANDGGGIYNDADGLLTITSVTLFGANTAGNDGGGIANAGVLSVTNSQMFSLFFGNHANNDGGGIANAGALSMTGSVRGFTGMLSNGASAGGGIYNVGGTVTLTNETVSGNGANDGGGVYNAGGTLTLSGCAVTSNGANIGGGVYNAGGALTLTSDSFTANSVGTSSVIISAAASRSTGGTGLGGGLFTVNGKATLTDDIFYGDTVSGGGVSEIAGRVTATFCDIQQASGSVFPGAGNLDADPMFSGSGNGPFGPSVQPAANSPVLGRGTTNAPSFRPTDLFGRLYLDPPAIGAVEGPQDAHVLWTNPDGRTIFWDTNAQGSHLVAGNYDPLTDPQGNSGYAARSLSTGTDGVSHILWSTPDGHVALWDVNVDGTHTDSYYGPFSDDGTAATIWQPVAVSTDGSNVTHILWDNPNGRTILWDVNSDGTFTVKGNYGGFSDDGTGQTVWKAVALASGPDGLNHVLWDNADGHTLLWNLDAADDQPADSGSPATASASQNDTSTSSAYGIFSDDGSANTIWHAQALSVGQDDLPRLLWTNPDGRTILWNVNSDGTFAITGNFDPLLDPAGQGGFTAVALATGFDNRSHFAWDNANGETYLWNLLNDGGNGMNDTVSPFYYGIFSDDGTSSTYWKAVAVSAAQPVSGS